MICFAPLVHFSGAPSHQTAGLGAAMGMLLIEFETLQLNPCIYELGSPHLIFFKNKHD